MVSIDDDLAVELSRSLSESAVALFSTDSVTETLQRIVDRAVETIDGCDFAGIFLVRDEEVTTPACSDRLVVELDALQFANDEGPCLDAVSERAVFYAGDLSDDERWPRFGPAAAAAGARSLLAVPFPGTTMVAALNLYSHLPNAFEATDRAKGLIYATLAGHALESATAREDQEQRSVDLHLALATRELIGQAQGILMERGRITATEAFAVLRRTSQHLNIKLREVAHTLVDTGETPPQPPPPS